MKRTYSWPEGHWGWLIPVTHKHGIRSGRMAYVGGQVDKDIQGLVLHHYDLKTQTRVVVGHIRTVLGELGLSLDDIVKLTAFYVNDGRVDEAAFLVDLRTQLGGFAPALTTVPIPYLAYPGMLLEIDTIAMRGEDDRALPRTVSPASGPFAESVRCGDMIFVSGRLARDAGAAMDEVASVLATHGATLDDVVKINSYYVGDGDAWRRSVAALHDRFATPGPVITGIPLRWLPEGHAIKTDVIAMRGEDGRPLRRERVPASGGSSELCPAPFSPALRCGDMIFVSGQVSKDAADRVVDPDALVPQTHAVMGRVRDLLGGFGLSMDEVVKVNAFFKSGGTAEELNANLRVRSACFTEPGPATTGISLPSLADAGLMIDVEITAMPR